MVSHLEERVASPARLAALQASGALDGGGNAGLDRITRLATALLGTPVSLVSLVDIDRQVFVSQQGLDAPWAEAGQTPLSHSFCQHVVADATPLVVSDARLDDRLRENLAITDLGVIAYCGVPLTTAEGHTLGSFCVIDGAPREWTDEEVLLVKDLAGLVQVELSLAESQAGGADATSVLVAGLAHDMRSMVSAVTGGARMLARMPDIDEAQRLELLGVVERQSDQLGALMDRLLAASTGGQALPDVAADVSVSALVNDVGASYALAGIDRVQVAGEQVVSAAVDVVTLRRCLTNLVDNALKHAGENAQVTITATSGPDAVIITVADDGVGMSELDQGLAFARGHQGHDAGLGHGLGLHIVRLLVGRMGGALELDSTVDVGTTLTITLPHDD